MENKAILLENDNFFWEGLEDFCKLFDPEFITHSTSPREWDVSDDYQAVGFLSQPFISNLVVASAFESEVYTTHKEDPYPQLLHYLEIIEVAFRLRERLGYKPFEIHVNFHGENFAQEVIDENWGWETSANIKRFVRQNPDTLKIKVYKEYNFQYILSEELFDKLTEEKIK